MVAAPRRTCVTCWPGQSHDGFTVATRGEGPFLAACLAGKQFLETDVSCLSGVEPVEDTVSVLSQIPYFQGVPEAVLALLALGARQIPVERDQIIVLRGEPCQGTHIVVKGRVKLVYTMGSGVEHIMRIISPGDSFGEAMMVLERDYIVTAEALSDGLLLYICRDAVLTQMKDSPELAHQLVTSLSRHLYMMMGDVNAYTLHAGHQRLIGYMLRESGGIQGVPVRFPIAKGVIALRLNLTPQHLSRILRKLIERGLIYVRGREFTILDAQKLRACYRDPHFR